MLPSALSDSTVLKPTLRQAPQESTYAQGSSPNRDYTVRVSRVLVRKGFVAIDLSGGVRAGNSDEEETHEENRVLDALDHCNAPINPGLPGSGGWSKDAGGGGSCCGSGAGPRRPSGDATASAHR